MRNIAVKVSYDGSKFNGFQTQPYGRTVQDEIEKVLRKITKESTDIHASGRTDAGVHATGQVFHFFTNSSIPVERIPIALNTILPKDIVILTAVEVDERFHARHSALRKTYRYTIDTGKFPAVLGRQYRLHHPQSLNFVAMQEGLAYIVGEHDFTSYTSTRSTKAHHVRTIYEAKLESEGLFWHLTVTGNGFTYNMVRTIMGTLLWVGQGKKQPIDIKHILERCDRSLAGPTALAHGLVLAEVAYDIQI
ncbi:tRNA pseudouridine(38-40) synthase TruA [Paenibacillus yanchengensis]|uniref:tRNA pseudouridine synthase A n=1 Tax=Paenibacillus yanchengensis TaxID=2035833 RepID=A0ABW4YHT4_9BACL